MDFVASRADRRKFQTGTLSLIGVFLFSNIYQLLEIVVNFCFKWKAAEKNLVNFFQDKSSFSRVDLFNYFLEIEGELKEGTFGWRIYDLKRKSILREIKRGWYTLNVKPIYVPAIDDRMKKLSAIFTSNYRNTRYCLWNISWLNEFTVHQFNRELFLFETEKDLQEPVANTLSDNGLRNVIWSLKVTGLSSTNSGYPIIILALISRAPIQNIGREDEK